MEPMLPCLPSKMAPFKVATGAARWSVDSEATLALMSALYAGLRAGDDPASALMTAENTLASQKGWAHPFYWAGFDLYGKDNYDGRK